MRNELFLIMYVCLYAGDPISLMLFRFWSDYMLPHWHTFPSAKFSCKGCVFRTHSADWSNKTCAYSKRSLRSQQYKMLSQSLAVRNTWLTWLRTKQECWHNNGQKGKHERLGVIQFHPLYCLESTWICMGLTASKGKCLSMRSVCRVGLMQGIDGVV